MHTKVSVFLLSVFAMLAGTLLSGAEFELFRNGKAFAVIVQTKNSTKKMTQDIKYFNDELARVTGSRLPVTASAVSGKNRILFKLETRPLAATDNYSITFPDKRTMLITSTEQSARYALNHILQKYAQINYFFTPVKGFYGKEINFYPKKKDIAVPMKGFRDAPVVNLYRCASWRNSIGHNWNMNMLIHGVHMMVIDVFPVWKYAPDRSWPREIMPVLRGKKFIPKKPAKLPLSKNRYVAKRGYDVHYQFCWSHPATVRIAVENILELMKKEPDRKEVNLDVNDNGGFCQCKTCLKIVNGKRNSIGKFDYSPIYWKWVNDVAGEVCKTHPDLIIRGIAYTEVLNPPSFKLHKNVLPVICMELIVMLDPKVGPVKQKLWDDWASKANQLGLYDYMYGESFYLLPRIYIRSHAKLLKNLILKNKLRSLYFECASVSAGSGPQQKLLYHIGWDPRMDVDQFLKQYYIDCVGKKAAPYLERYFDFWERYWTGKEIRRTQWYRSVTAAYMHLGERATHTYALKKGDLKYVRSLMEKVIALAGTPDQKRRAKAIMQSWEYYELAAQAVFAEILPADGTLRRAKQAEELLKAVPGAIKALNKYMRHPFLRFSHVPGKSLAGNTFSAVGKVMPFVKDPAVRAQLKKLAARKDLPVNLLGQIKIMLGAKAVNLIKNGDLEQGKLPLQILWSRKLPGKRDTAHASSGKYAYKMRQGAFQIHPKIQKGKTYMFMCDVFIAKTEVEARVNFKFGPSRGRMPLSWIQKLDQCPTAGVWNTYSETFMGHQRGDSVLIQFWSRNIERNNPIWIDNIRLYCLDDLK